MTILFFVFFILLLFLLFLFIERFLKKEEHFCFGNDFCNRRNALCIEQKCFECGLQPSCKKDSDCGPNNCVNGCCDTL
jgi:hypothetical protein